MRRYALDPRCAPLSELVFGAASLGGRVSERDGLAALDAAHEQGITGVDLARSYGFGTAEGIIGRALGSRRDRFVIITKAGIEPTRPNPLMLAASRVAGPLVARFGQLAALRRRLVTAVAAAPATSARPLEPATLIASLETSLRELRTDCVDVFLTHRCPSTRAEYDAIGEACARARDAGKLVLWGISGDVAAVRAVTQHAPPPVAQVPGDVLSRHAADTLGLARELVMYYQPFGGGAGFTRLLAAAPSDLTRAERARWATEVALRGLLRGAAGPTVAVCAMNQTAHVAANVAAMSHPRLSDATLLRICQRLERDRP